MPVSPAPCSTTAASSANATGCSSTASSPCPRDGADLAVTYGGHELGRFVLMPGDRPVGVSLAQRRCAVALADQLACSLATATT